MSKSKKYKRPTTWNNIKYKPDIVDVIADDDDIVMKLHGMWFLCQRKNGLNNLVSLRDTPAPLTGKQVITAMFDFCYHLAIDYGIEFATIKGKPGKYNFIDRFFPDDCRLSPNLNENGEEVRYIRLTDEKALHKLDLLRKMNVSKKAK